ncbi:hypothetical protein R5R35_013620 [Gryllus longicercus]|uniref:cholesterol 7-desaturase n=1 Tax=Gryllus longicercus TaxID=2509291 RepID=A0AAN9V0S7_9ORTH
MAAAAAAQLAHLAPVDALGWVQALLAAAALFLVYRYLIRPLDYRRDLSDVGFGHVGGVAGAGVRHRRADVVRDVRRRRRVGALPPVYPNGWFALLESDALPAGEVRHVAALGENWAVLRTADGQAHVLDAYCPHLGANMAVGGAVRGDCLECPFHGWRFNAHDGRCAAVPYADKVPEFARVKRWESCEANGFVFVWYHAEGEPPSWQVEAVPQVARGEWLFRGRSEFLINSHIQEIPENGGDVAHLNAIHAPSLLGGGDLVRAQKLPFRFLRHVWAAAWAAQTEPGRTHLATMHLQHETRLLGKVRVLAMDVRAEQIGPAYVEMYLRSALGDLLIVQAVTPLEPLLQRVVHHVYAPPRLALFAPLLLLSEAIMFERDIMVWNHKKYEDKPLLVREDKTIQRHRRWYSQFYSENSPRHSFVSQNSLDW